MSLFHRRRKGEDIVTPEDEQPAQAAASAEEAGVGLEDKETQGRVARALAALRRKTSASARVRRLLADMGWLSVVLAVISFMVLPTEWWLVILSVVIANLAMYAYTKWVYKPPVVSVVQFSDDGTEAVLGAWAIPIPLWDDMVKVGMSNTIRTAYGTTYLVKSIAFDEETPGLPIAIEFSWRHYNELNFSTKREMFDELRSALKIAWDQNNRYRSLMEIITTRKALALVKRWISLISHGRYAPVTAQDEVHLNREISELARQGQGLRMPKGEDRTQDTLPGEEEGFAPL